MRKVFLSVLIFNFGCVIPPTGTISDGVKKLREGEITEAKLIFIDNLRYQETSAAYDGLGCTEFYEGNYDSAERSFLKALDIDDRNLSAKENLALMYTEIGRELEAERLYFEVTKDRNTFRVINNYAEYLSSLGKRREAKRNLEHAYRISNNKTVWRNLSYEKGS